MNPRRFGLLLLLALVPVTRAADTNTLARAVSASRQFVAYSADPLLPHAVCAFSDQVRRDWLELLNLSPSWRDPIILLFQSRLPGQTNLPSTSVRIAQTDLHLKYQITCVVPPPLDAPTLVPPLVEALCAELANRVQLIARGQPYQPAPSPMWMVAGLSQSILGRDETLFQLSRRSLAGGHAQTAGMLVSATQLPDEPHECRLFRANSWLLAESLLSLPAGTLKMQRYLAELGAQKNLTNAFWTAYHDVFPSERALEKWWALQLAERATTVVAKNLTVPETVERLDEIVSTAVAGETKAVPFPELWRYNDATWLREVLKDKLFRLTALRANASPRCRETIDDYVEAVRCLAGRKIQQFKHLAGKADSARTALEQFGRQVRAYLDQSERIFAGQDISSANRDFFRVFEQNKSLERNRRSPVSDYLDKFDR